MRLSARILRFTLLPLILAPLAPAHPDPSHSLAEIESHLAETPENTELLAAKATILLEGRHPRLARATADEALRISPEDPSLLLLRAKVAEGLGDPQDAIDRTNSILVNFPDFTRAAGFAARLHHRAGRIGQAITQKLRQLQGEDAGPEDILTAAAWLRERNRPGDREAAIGELDRGISRFGVLSALQHSAISLETSLGLYDSALARVDKLVTRFGPSVASSLLRADIFEAAGRHQEAAAACDSALALLALESADAGAEVAPLKNTIQDRKQRNLAKAGT